MVALQAIDVEFFGHRFVSSPSLGTQGQGAHVFVFFPAHMPEQLRGMLVN